MPSEKKAMPPRGTPSMATTGRQPPSGLSVTGSIRASPIKPTRRAFQRTVLARPGQSRDGLADRVGAGTDASAGDRMASDALRRRGDVRASDQTADPHRVPIEGVRANVACGSADIAFRATVTGQRAIPEWPGSVAEAWTHWTGPLAGTLGGGRRCTRRERVGVWLARPQPMPARDRM